MFDPKLQINERVGYEKIPEIFKCSPQGGMRRSLATNTLVLVSNHYSSIYEDRWIGDVLHYTGMGQAGDQSINRNQNRTLYESDSNDVAVFLFEKFGPKGSLYYYRGRVELASEPYQVAQPDKDFEIRKVWVFPLRIVNKDVKLTVDKEELDDLKHRRDKKVGKLSDQELELHVRTRPQTEKVGRAITVGTSWQRDSHVAEFARRRADGVCELCETLAPFNDKRGRPVLEVHHIIWLSKGGPDTVDNVAALCPNCHRRMHILNDKLDVDKLTAKRRRDSPLSR